MAEQAFIDCVKNLFVCLAYCNGPESGIVATHVVRNTPTTADDIHKKTKLDVKQIQNSLRLFCMYFGLRNKDNDVYMFDYAESHRIIDLVWPHMLRESVMPAESAEFREMQKFKTQCDLYVKGRKK